MHKLILAVFAILLSGCGLENLISLKYQVKVENPEGVEMRCLTEQDNNSRTFTTSEKEILLTATTNNTFLYISCQKKAKDDDTSEIRAYFLVNDDIRETDVTMSEYGIVSASGMTN